MTQQGERSAPWAGMKHDGGHAAGEGTMETTAPVPATPGRVKPLLQLAHSTDPFLSVYLTTDPKETTTEGTRLRLASLLDRVATDLSGTSYEASFSAERERMEGFARSLRPGGPGLALLSSLPAGQWHALWLPEPVPDQARYGPGPQVLPLVRLLDDWEPVALALAERERVRLLVFAGGRLAAESETQTEVPGKHRAGGGYSTGFRGSAPIREAGGGAASRFERHIEAHVEQHFKESVRRLEELRREHGFRRLFLAGPEETRALFRGLLPRELSSRLVRELRLDAHASLRDIQERVRQEMQAVERRGEEEQVEELVTRAAKDAGAVTGVAPTLWALNRRQAHRLIMMNEGIQKPGRRCLQCDLLLPEENPICPQCQERTQQVDLWDELASFALGHGAEVEVVHGEAASQLFLYDGLGAILEPTTR